MAEPLGAARSAPRVLFLGSGLGEASWRFRVAQYLPALRERGIEVAAVDLHRPWPTRLRLLAAARGADAVCIHRALLTPLELAWLRRIGVPYVFDFDDAIMFRDSAHVRQASPRRQRRVARMLRGARAVVAGNDYLAGLARPHAAAVVVIPTAVDPTEYRTEAAGARSASPARGPQPSAQRPSVVGWIGSRSTLMYLRALVPALRRLAARRPGLEIRVICDARFEAPELPVVNRTWSRADEAAELRALTVGLMPLPDDPWTRGKCAVKILQYFAAGVPVVCSPVGVNREVVEHGASGFFAAGEAEWVASVEALLADGDLRQRFAARGRAVVEERFAVERTLPALLGVLLPDPGGPAAPTTA